MLYLLMKEGDFMDMKKMGELLKTLRKDIL